MKIISIIAAIMICSTASASVWAITERAARMPLAAPIMKPVVMVYVAGNCPACDKAHRELDEAVGLPYEFRFSADTPEWMRADPRTLYPTFYWPSGKGHRMIRGWYGVSTTVEAIRKNE